MAVQLNADWGVRLRRIRFWVHLIFRRVERNHVLNQSKINKHQLTQTTQPSIAVFSSHLKHHCILGHSKCNKLKSTTFRDVERLPNFQIARPQN